MRSLSEIIQDKITTDGPLSFHDFMEMALYYPGLGYYTSEPDKIGKQGDYYTIPYFTGLYGKLVAKQLEEMWLLSDKNEFTIVEYGAGLGSLCCDILEQLKKNPAFYKKLKYCIIEKSKPMRQKELKALHDSHISFEKVYWYDAIEEMPPFTGCILANEVVDNFAVHKVVMREEGLMEVFVDYNDGFIEILEPAGENLINYFEQLRVELPVGFCTEINLEALDWIKGISVSLQKGFVLTMDYGFPSSELYQSNRQLGTIVCYNKHTVNDLPYNNIGQQDITAHVNFSALELWGRKNGLINCGFTNQSQFLLSLGLTEQLRKIEEAEKNNYKVKEKLLFLHTLLMSMGKKIKVLIQQKGLNCPALSGLKFSQPLV
jgi:SAM-dependent MidA family methyltransferase